jgi:hypothetical protein
MNRADGAHALAAAGRRHGQQMAIGVVAQEVPAMAADDRSGGEHVPARISPACRAVAALGQLEVRRDALPCAVDESEDQHECCAADERRRGLPIGARPLGRSEGVNPDFWMGRGKLPEILTIAREHMGSPCLDGMGDDQCIDGRGRAGLPQ